MLFNRVNPQDAFSMFHPVPFSEATPVEHPKGVPGSTGQAGHGGVKVALAECDECHKEIFLCKNVKIVESPNVMYEDLKAGTIPFGNG